MKRSPKSSNTELLIAEFLSNGGSITICKPKLAPKKRITSGKSYTRDQLRSFLGSRALQSKVA